MLVATDLKNGVTFLMDGKPYKIQKYTFTKMGRGGATVRVWARNLETFNLEEKSFQSTAKFDEVVTKKKALQYLYKDGETAYFMDPTTYEQIEVALDILGDDIYYVKEGEKSDVLFWGDKALSVDIPPKVVLTVKDTAPGVKGNSATNIYKPAEMENGLTIKVPLFVKTGDKIRVDSRTSEYVERA